MRYLRSFWFSAATKFSVRILVGLGGGQGSGGNRPERRLRGQDRSGVSLAVSRLVHLLTLRTKDLRDWHNAINPQENVPLPSDAAETYRGQFTHRFRGGSKISLGRGWV